MAKPAMKVSPGNPKVPALQHLQTAGLHRVIPVYFKPAPEKKVSRIKAENTAPLEGGIRGHWPGFWKGKRIAPVYAPTVRSWLFGAAKSSNQKTPGCPKKDI